MLPVNALSAVDSALQGGYLFRPAAELGLEIYDIRPAGGLVEGRVLAKGQASDMAWQAPYLYSVGGQMLIFDLAGDGHVVGEYDDPDDPKLGRAVTVMGPVALLGTSRSLVTLDVSDAAAPKRVNSRPGASFRWRSPALSPSRQRPIRGSWRSTIATGRAGTIGGRGAAESGAEAVRHQPFAGGDRRDGGCVSV
ncbi:MAG: hypothetical protein IPP47_07540 [Bryobacterales bacterium]|nr:hypothetical protein [Bryobacterales bacterium]